MGGMHHGDMCCMNGGHTAPVMATVTTATNDGYSMGAQGWGQSNQVSAPAAITMVKQYADATYVSNLQVNGVDRFGGYSGNMGAGLYSGGNVAKCSRCQGNQPRYASGAYGTSLPISGGCGCNKH